MNSSNRKIINKNRMYTGPEKSKLNRVGTDTGLLDMHNNHILVGDQIFIPGSINKGIVLYNSNEKCFGIYYGAWYGDDLYDPNTYGKFIRIPSDNGMKMQLLKFSKDIAE